MDFEGVGVAINLRNSCLTLCSAQLCMLIENVATARSTSKYDFFLCLLTFVLTYSYFLEENSSCPSAIDDSGRILCRKVRSFV